MSDTELALFPLKRAVVPGAKLRLQLFEQRYLKMARGCLATEKCFGIVGLKSGGEAIPESEFYPVGCRVQIEDWDQLQNGLLGIRLRANRRFAVRSKHQQADGLWTAEVDWLEDKAVRGDDWHSQYQGLADLYLSLATHFGQQPDPLQDAASLGWAVAGFIPLNNEDLAGLLLEDDPLERLRLIALKIDQLATQ